MTSESVGNFEKGGDGLNVIGGRRHRLGDQAHDRLGWRREFSSTKRNGHLGVIHFIDLHLLNHDSRPGIAFGKTIQMPRQMRLDLPFRFSQESEIPAIAKLAGKRPER